MPDRPSVLYVSYDGALEPLGESQVVSYLERLASDCRITLLSFEKAADLSDHVRVRAMAERLAACRVAWLRLRYHKRPPVLSTMCDVVRGIVRARAACRRGPVAIIHARGYVPSLIALASRRASDARFLFDMRGFWVDEKVEAGHWTANGLLYRAGKWWERRFFSAADGIVSLTQEGVRAFGDLGHQVPARTVVDVIPTCVDLDHFTPAPKDPELLASFGLTDGPIVGCVGTMSNWYLRREMLRYLAHLAEELTGARILIVTREPPEALRAEAEQWGIPPDRLVLTRAAFAEMPRFVRLFDAGVFFIRPTLSKRGSAATKLAEFLACGVPVIINAGVGDSGALVNEHRVGLVLPRVEPPWPGGSAADVRMLLADRGLALRCRRVAEEMFDLGQGVERYRRLYQRLQAASPRARGVDSLPSSGKQ